MCNSCCPQIVPAADAIVGKWRMDIDTKNRNLDGAVSFTMAEPFYLIFNPWCEGNIAVSNGVFIFMKEIGILTSVVLIC